jgi:hypothetical protein
VLRELTMARNRERDSNGKFTRTIDHAAQDAAAAGLRARGATYDAIAIELGYCDRHAARRAVERALVATVTEPAAEVRQLELARLDEMYRAALAVLERQHLTVSHGKVVHTGGVPVIDDRGNVTWVGGEPLLDDAPVLQAIDRMIRIMERRAKLLGLDAPTKVEVITLDAIEAEIRRLNDELGESDGVDLGSVDDAAGVAPAQG